MQGAARAARFLTNLTQRYRDRTTAEAVTVNDEPGVLVRLDGQVGFVAAFEVEVDCVRTVRIVRNPEKLHLITSGPRLI